MTNQLEKLKNQYPLNTFKGETHKELVNLIGLVIFNEREMVRKSIVRKIEKKKQELVTGGYEGEQEMNIEISTHNQTISEIISIINEQK